MKRWREIAIAVANIEALLARQEIAYLEADANELSRHLRSSSPILVMS